VEAHLLRSTRRYVFRRRDGVRNGGRGVASADATVVDALDHLLDPLEELRQEQFHTEPEPEHGPPAAAKLAHETTFARSAALVAVRRAKFLVAQASGTWRALRLNVVPYVFAVVVAVIVGWVLAQSVSQPP
jgi:hypothetical protein